MCMGGRLYDGVWMCCIGVSRRQYLRRNFDLRLGKVTQQCCLEMAMLWQSGGVDMPIPAWEIFASRYPSVKSITWKAKQCKCILQRPANR